ncbi:MAG: hypothetical protein PVSMB10_09080 [Pseudarthrobacter sp.]
MPVSQLPAKGRVLCHGFIESVTFLPTDQSPAFTAMVIDPEGQGAGRGVGPGIEKRLRVVWLGRRRVPGIEAGTEVRVEGMLTQSHGLPTIFNPRYEIISSQEHA